MRIKVSLDRLRNAVAREFGIEVLLDTEADVVKAVEMLLRKYRFEDATVQEASIDRVLGEEAIVAVEGERFVEAIAQLQRLMRG